ncbi:hypothetical protein J2Y38_000082 [Flavobacterium sp. 2755]|uniref:hypothetical protein n=1 Tax=Flavobacterium sp. 2755 TaxID=2817765 RepID=UPI0028673B59|nr:hypothetical protein [Flavobacterium sp. 2755]MDR6759903.1 hypothetical protein [Flavobacterium sp. 2755]
MNQNNLYSLLDLIWEKPHLYIGDKHLSTLYYTINGYQLYVLNNKVNENLIPEWSSFHDFVSIQLNYSESTSGYRTMILKTCNFDEEKAFIEFYRLFDLFRKT